MDEDNGEMFVSDFFTRKIYVYDLFGKFKRGFDHKDGATYKAYTDIFNYDNNNLICYSDAEKAGFYLVSKKDGSITQDIKIPFENKKYLRQSKTGGTSITTPPPGMKFKGISVTPPNSQNPITPYNNNWILLEFSSDTMYRFLPDYSLRPYIGFYPRFFYYPFNA